MLDYVKEPSIYHAYNIVEDITESVKDVPEWSRDMDSPLGEFGFNVLQVLNKYGTLNRKNIEYCVNLRNPSTWKKNNLDNVLRALRKASYINTIGLKPFKESVTYTLTLYTLTAKANDYMQKCGIRPYHKIVKDYSNKKKVEELLTVASINQWHIGLIRNYGESISESRYMGMKIKGGITIPSFVKIQNIKLLKKENINIYALPAPRNEENIKRFLLDTIILQSHIVKRQDRKTVSFIVTVCESMPHACWLASYVNKYRQTRPFYIVYTHDMATIRDNLLKNMYLCEANNTGIKQISMDLLK